MYILTSLHPGMYVHMHVYNMNKKYIFQNMDTYTYAETYILHAHMYCSMTIFPIHSFALAAPSLNKLLGCPSNKRLRQCASKSLCTAGPLYVGMCDPQVSHDTFAYVKSVCSGLLRRKAVL